MNETTPFWREVQALIRDEIARAHKTQAVAPNTPFGSVVVDQYGHIVHGAAAGAGSILKAYCNKSVAQTISASGTTVVNFDAEIYDPDGKVTVGAAWKYVVPTTAWYLIDPVVRFAEISSGWSAGDTATMYLRVNGGNIEYIDLLDDPQNATRNNTLGQILPFQLDQADEVAIGIQLSTTGGKDIEGSIFCRLGIYLVAT